MFCISVGSVVTHLTCSGKSDTIIVVNLLLNRIVTEFLKSSKIFFTVMNEYQATSSYCMQIERSNVFVGLSDVRGEKLATD